MVQSGVAKPFLQFGDNKTKSYDLRPLWNQLIGMTEWADNHLFYTIDVDIEIRSNRLFLQLCNPWTIPRINRAYLLFAFESGLTIYFSWSLCSGLLQACNFSKKVEALAKFTRLLIFTLRTCCGWTQHTAHQHTINNSKTKHAVSHNTRTTHYLPAMHASLTLGHVPIRSHWLLVSQSN